MNVVVLVDFENDSVRTSLEVARALGPRLWGVRLDTSEHVYGVGSSLLRGANDFTGDIVRTDGNVTAKVGRWERPNPRLELVT